MANISSQKKAAVRHAKETLKKKLGSKAQVAICPTPAGLSLRVNATNETDLAKIPNEVEGFSVDVVRIQGYEAR